MFDNVNTPQKRIKLLLKFLNNNDTTSFLRLFLGGSGCSTEIKSIRTNVASIYSLRQYIHLETKSTRIWPVLIG